MILCFGAHLSLSFVRVLASRQPTIHVYYVIHYFPYEYAPLHLGTIRVNLLYKKIQKNSHMTDILVSNNPNKYYYESGSLFMHVRSWKLIVLHCLI